MELEGGGEVVVQEEGRGALTDEEISVVVGFELGGRVAGSVRGGK